MKVTVVKDVSLSYVMDVLFRVLVQSVQTTRI
nr:MAG TPA: hypothetical protein [Caudoviricetes sp.]